MRARIVYSMDLIMVSMELPHGAFAVGRSEGDPLPVSFSTSRHATNMNTYNTKTLRY